MFPYDKVLVSTEALGKDSGVLWALRPIAPSASPKPRPQQLHPHPLSFQLLK